MKDDIQEFHDRNYHEWRNEKISDNEYFMRKTAIEEEMKNAKADYQANQVSNQE